MRVPPFRRVWFRPTGRASRLLFAGTAGVLLAVLPICGRRTPAPPASRPPSDLARLVEALSEPGGFFDTDNLVSNESSYLQVADHLETVARGGVYLGVGPEQNFSYIARLRPRWAFILDIRRQNMLQHLLYNAIFEKAEDPYRYLCWLFSRPGPRPAPVPREAPIAQVLSALEPVAPSEEAFSSNLPEILGHIEGRLGFPLTAEDRAAIRSIYRGFFEGQLELRFRSYGRPVRLHHPTYRSLLLARSPSGKWGHFLNSAEDYRFLRKLVRSGRVVPVVGDFAGPRALPAVGRFLRDRGETVSAFYVSNVEFYLMQSGSFDRFISNVRELPVTPDSLFIRACFDYGHTHPASLVGHRSTTLLQGVPRFLELHEEGAYRTYWDVCTADYVPSGLP